MRIKAMPRRKVTSITGVGTANINDPRHLWKLAGKPEPAEISADIIRRLSARIGADPLRRLEWMVEFANRDFITGGDRQNAQLELACFLNANLTMSRPDKPVPLTGWLVCRTEDLEVVRDGFRQILLAAATGLPYSLPLNHTIARWSDGLIYEQKLLARSDDPEDKALREAQIERSSLALLRFLDSDLRGISMWKYLAVCPPERRGCGEIFARSRIDKEYCSKECGTRARVRRFRNPKEGK